MELSDKWCPFRGQYWEQCSLTFPSVTSTVGLSAPSASLCVTFGLDIRTGFFYDEGGEALQEAAKRGAGCPIPGDTQGQAGRGSEQPDLAVGVPVPCRGVGLDDL